MTARETGTRALAGPLVNARALVPVSRAVIYAFRVEGADWRTAAAAEAARLRREVWSASGW